MKRTSLYDLHKTLGAKMIGFGGWEMPRDYASGTVAEVKATRTNAGLFDVSHMGEFLIQGPDSLKFLQYLVTNDLQRIQPGKAQYSLLLNESGGVKDDILVYWIGDHEFLVVANAGCKEKDWEWLVDQSHPFQVALTDLSDRTALIAVQGPNAVKLVNELIDVEADSIPRFSFRNALFRGMNVRLSRTGYTGEDGFEIFCPWNDAASIWSSLVESGGVPCGLAARDVLRLEAAYPLYGHELTEDESPAGNGVHWAIRTGKVDFIGRNSYVKLMQYGIRTKLVGLKVETPANAIPREGCLVFAENVEEPIGRVTSGTLSPILGRGIALAKVGAGYSEVASPLTIDIRGRKVAAKVVKLPFYSGLK